MRVRPVYVNSTSHMEPGVQSYSWSLIVHASRAAAGRLRATLASCDRALLSASIALSHWSMRLNALRAMACEGREVFPVGAVVSGCHQWISFAAFPLVRNRRFRVNIHSELLCISWLSSVRA